MKKLTVIFPVYRDELGIWEVMMGKKKPGTKLSGIRNGFGGKCEEGEEVEDCAVREMREESGVEVKKEDLRFLGTISQGQNNIVNNQESEVSFFAYEVKERFEVKNSPDFEDISWFSLTDRSRYVSDMLPGNEEIMKAVLEVLEGKFTKFELDLSSSEARREAIKGIWK